MDGIVPAEIVEEPRAIRATLTESRDAVLRVAAALRSRGVTRDPRDRQRHVVPLVAGGRDALPAVRRAGRPDGRCPDRR